MFNKNQVVAVVMGGPSAEREVSLNTGAAIANALREYGYTNVVEIDLDPRNFGKQLAESKAEVVFNAVHGLYGAYPAWTRLLPNACCAMQVFPPRPA